MTENKKCPVTRNRKIIPMNFLGDATGSRAIPPSVSYSMEQILLYNWIQEESDYEESTDLQAEHHIFNHMMIVRNWLYGPKEQVVPAPVFWATVVVGFTLVVFFIPEIVFLIRNIGNAK